MKDRLLAELQSFLVVFEEEITSSRLLDCNLLDLEMLVYHSRSTFTILRKLNDSFKVQVRESGKDSQSSNARVQELEYSIELRLLQIGEKLDNLLVADFPERSDSSCHLHCHQRL